MKNIVFLILMTISGICSADEDGYAILRKLGFNLVNQAAEDFSLPLANSSGEKKLSDYKGKWIWVAFWATWCGPCVYEMPLLESLNIHFKDANFNILGVNVDKGKTPTDINRFLKSKGITFDNFIDERSQVSASYQANALPSIYAINPDFKIVGIFRGANNWEQQGTLDLVKKLIESKNLGELDISTQSKESLLAPPTLNLTIDEENKHQMNVQVKWEGSIHQYQMKVPELIVPDGVDIGDIQTESYSKGSDNVLVYKYPLTFNKSGEFEIGPAEQQFLSADKTDQIQYARTTTVKISIPVPFYKKRSLQIIFIILLISLILGGFFLNRASKQKKMEYKKQEELAQKEEYKKTLEAKFNELLQLEYKGQKIDFVVGILNLEQEIEMLHNNWSYEQSLKKQDLISKIKFASSMPLDSEISSKKNKLSNFFSKERVEDELE